MKDAENEDLRGQDLGIGELDSVRARPRSVWLRRQRVMGYIEASR